MEFPKFFSRVPFFFGPKKLLLAFEYGLILSELAHKEGVEVTPEMVKRAEKMIEGEFSTQRATHLAGNIVPNIMTVFELDISK